MLPTIAGAQDKTVIFKVLDDLRAPLSYTFISITPLEDSTRTLKDVADSTGIAAFHLPAQGRYRVDAQAASFTFKSRIIDIAQSSDTIVLVAEALSNRLSGVTVTYRKPLMRQEDDKTIIDPEEIAASSTNAFEMMEKIPALFIDQDGNIYLNSMTPAKVYINGREQKMSTADVATILRSLPPGSIERIEILRTPSSRFDASGGGGIVNVVLKKGVRIGLTGSVNGGFNQGTYGNQFVGLSLNNGNGATTSYINMQYSRRKSWDRIITDRQFSPDSVLSQNAYTIYPAESYYIGYGIGHELNDKWSINYDGRLSLNRSDNRSKNPSAIANTAIGDVFSSNAATIDTKADNWSINQGINLKYKIDTTGSDWVTDVSYNYSPSTTQQDFTTAYTRPVAALLQGDGYIDYQYHLLTMQSDLTKKLPDNLSLEAGLKSTNVWFTNNSVYHNTFGGNRVVDGFRTRRYSYTEHIHAAYVQASKTMFGFTLKLGTRAEHTDMNGQQRIPADTSFLLRRTDLFPYAYLSRKIMSVASYEVRAFLIYRRTINRPAYEYLNPFPRYIDPYLFETGNPTLRPQFTHNYEANISVEERPLFALGYNDTRDIFTQVVYQSPNDRSQAYRTYDNLGRNKETYLRLMGAIPPGKVYFFVIGGQYNYNIYEGLYEGQPLLFKRGSWSAFTYHRLKLAKATTLSLNGFARFNGLAQFYELGSFGALNISLNQKFLDNKLSVTLNAQDVFFTNNNKFVLDQGSVYATGLRNADTRRFGINISYNFGFRKKEDNNMFNVESPERANGN